MIGAIIGDIVGSRFEHHNSKTKDFNLFSPECRYTDDSVMSLAICEALLACKGNYANLSEQAVRSMQQIGSAHPHRGYGGRFRKWLASEDPRPYYSFGNGAGMRVSGCAYAGNSLDEVKELSRKVTVVTHDHPEGIKGAEAIAVAVYLARTGKTKDEIRGYINEHYYPMGFTLDSIRAWYHFDVTSQGSVPHALEAFFESVSYEDAIRNAISLGGDSDTIAAMTGSIAEAYWGVPDAIREQALPFLDDQLRSILERFEAIWPGRRSLALTNKRSPTTTEIELKSDEKMPGNEDGSPKAVPISEEDFLRKIAKMYSEHVYEDIDCYLERDFHCGSFWEFDELTSAEAYVSYIRRRVAAFGRANVDIRTTIMYLNAPGGMFDEPPGKPFLVIERIRNPDKLCLFVKRSENGLIARMDMMPCSFYDLVPEPI